MKLVSLLFRCFWTFGWDCNLQPSKSVTHRQSCGIGWLFKDGDYLRMCISWMLSSQISTVHELIGKSQLQVVSVYSKRFPNKRNSSDQKWGFNFRVFPLSHETWSMVEPRMQAGLSSPHFDELRMEPLGSPICWGSVMKDWNHWNHLRDSRNCFCVSCVWGKLSKANLSYQDITTYHETWQIQHEKTLVSLWAMTEAPNRVEIWMTSWFLVCLNPLISWCGMLNYWSHLLYPTVLVWGI